MRLHSLRKDAEQPHLLGIVPGGANFLEHVIDALVWLVVRDLLNDLLLSDQIFGEILENQIPLFLLEVLFFELGLTEHPFVRRAFVILQEQDVSASAALRFSRSNRIQARNKPVSRIWP